MTVYLRVRLVDPAAYTYLQVSEKSLQPQKVWLVAGNSEKGLSHQSRLSLFELSPRLAKGGGS